VFVSRLIGDAERQLRKTSPAFARLPGELHPIHVTKGAPLVCPMCETPWRGRRPPLRVMIECGFCGDGLICL
jgi:hypothetical protein